MQLLAVVTVLSVGLAACAGDPAATATLDPDSPAGRGRRLFSGVGRCSSCHALAGSTVIVGPALAGIATTAATRVAGLTAAEYIEESILRPDAYRPPGFENAQMDASLAKTLTVEQIDDLVAFMLTLE